MAYRDLRTVVPAELPSRRVANNNERPPDWLEQARREFAAKFTRDHYGIDPDDYEDCNQVYGDGE